MKKSEREPPKPLKKQNRLFLFPSFFFLLFREKKCGTRSRGRYHFWKRSDMIYDIYVKKSDIWYQRWPMLLCGGGVPVDFTVNIVLYIMVSSVLLQSRWYTLLWGRAVEIIASIIVRWLHSSSCCACLGPEVFLIVALLDLCQWKREVQKFFFNYTWYCFKKQPKIFSYRSCGGKREKCLIF